MMKMKIYLTYLQLLLVLLVSSCRKDLGNYDYKDLGEIQISNIEKEYLALTGQPFQIDPKLIFNNQKEFVESDYTYRWTATDMVSGAIPKKEIGTARLLQGDLSLAPSRYKIYYRVTEKATGLFWQTDFFIQVTSQMAGGWLVLNELNNEGRLDMLNYSLVNKDFTYYKDILRTFGDLQLSGKPLFVYYLRNQDVFNNKPSDRVYVGTDQKTLSFNVHEYKWDNYRDIKMEVFRPTSADYHAIKVLSTGVTSKTYMMDNEGSVSPEIIPNNIPYGNSVNRLATGSLIKVSPQIVQNYRSSDLYLIMFDTENRRFLANIALSAYSLLPKSDKPEVFNPLDVKKDLVFLNANTSTQGEISALLKDPSGTDLYLARFIASGSTFSLIDYNLVPNSEELKKAIHYAVDPTFGYFIYATENKIYAYDPVFKKHTLLADYGTRHISLLKYHTLVYAKKDTRLSDYSKSLLVCTYDPAAVEKSGKMEFFSLSLDSKLTAKEKYEGFDKIVSVSYRE